MASILVVCTGNVCRSPIAEGMLRAGLRARMGEDAPLVSSAGTAGWEGSAAMPESVQAASERGVDISGHAARRLSGRLLAEADLIVGMAAEHREEIGRAVPEVAGRTFTLKELVRLLEELPAGEPGVPEPPEPLTSRVARADELRRTGFQGDPRDEDVVDPLGLPPQAYRAIAWELEEWTARLADGLVGLAPARQGAEGT